MHPTKLRLHLEATAREVAATWHHPEVDARHVLVALIANGILDTDSTEMLIDLHALLDPQGTATSPPAISPEAEDLLQRCSDTASALFTAQRLVEQYLQQQPQSSADRPAPKWVRPETPGQPTTPAPDDAPRPDLTEVLDQLDDLVGLSEVKAAVHQLIALHQLNQARRAQNLPVVPVSLHLVFTGNPGTGKTTVARIIADVYSALGLLPKATVREVHRADLVAGYVGQTAKNVQTVVNETVGGVLFIDEAYALASPSAEDFGNEAIATLVKMMEDHREEFAVIAAGYSKEMEDFIDANSGLRSRFSRFIEFPDYSDTDLVEIIRRFAAERQVAAGPGVPEAILAAIQAAPPELRKGNGRFARNLFEHMYQRMAERVTADGTIGNTEVHAGFVVADVELP